jgi:HSP20 family protein
VQGDIDVKIDRDDLVVEGARTMQRESDGERFHRVERSYGKFSRRFRLPSAVDRGGIQAVLRDGLLSVTLPKRADAGPVSLKVSIGG